MKFYLKLGLILLAFSIVATGILAYVNSVTKPRIDKLKQEEAQKAREELIPKADFEQVSIAIPSADSLIYFVARDKESKELKGYTFVAKKWGYSSNVKSMCAVDPSFKIINIKIIEQAETPGLGANCTAESFTSMFKGLSLEQLKVDKDGGKEVKAMTGATITTRAVANSLRETITLVQKDVESKATEQPKEEVTK